MLKPIQGLKEILQKHFNFIIGISIAFFLIITLKCFLFKAYMTVHKFDIICLSETYLDSSTRSDDENLDIARYDIARADHPTNTKRGGVCIYYKKCVPLRVLNIVFLNECINFELSIRDKTCNFVVLYRSPSQSQDVFESFCQNFERTLDNFAQIIPFFWLL